MEIALLSVIGAADGEIRLSTWWGQLMD